MPSETQPQPTALLERFNAQLEELCNAVCDLGIRRRLAHALLWLICYRIEKLGERFRRLLERGPAAQPAKNPTPPAPQNEVPQNPGPQKSPPNRRLPKNWPGYAFGPPPKLPRSFRWLRNIISHHLFKEQIDQFARFLSDPELAALIKANPAIGRALRPLCHMMGIERPSNLQPPPPDPTTPKHQRPKRPPHQPTLAERRDPNWVGTFTYIPGVKKFTC